MKEKLINTKFFQSVFAGNKKTPQYQTLTRSPLLNMLMEGKKIEDTVIKQPRYRSVTAMIH